MINSRLRAAAARVAKVATKARESIQKIDSFEFKPRFFKPPTETEKPVIYSVTAETHLRIEATFAGGNIGYLDMALNGNQFFIDAIEVLPEHRQKGIATELLVRAIEEAKRSHISQIAVKPQPFGEQGMDRIQLMRFYIKHGFEPVEYLIFRSKD